MACRFLFFFATHFYFFTYHTAANLVQRRIVTGFQPGTSRSMYLVMVICGMAYTTAFMETLTISGFPYYSFEDRHMAYTVGSAFYAIYLVVSYPMFLRIDESPDEPPFTLLQTCMESLGSCMLIIILLDVVRASLGIQMCMPGELFALKRI